MMPLAIFDALTTDPTLNALGITATTVFERQSLDGVTRPGAAGFFLVIDLLEQAVVLGGQRRGPRRLDIAAHVPAEINRDYTDINRILNAVDLVLVPMTQVVGSDGVRVMQIQPMGRSRNLLDSGWKTITRAAQYSVLSGGP